MATATKDALNKLRSHLAKCGYLKSVQLGEPVQPPNDWDAFIVLLRFEPKPGQESTLSGTIERRVISIRVYTRILEEPRDDMELKIDEVAVKLHEDILGDYSLGATIRNVEFPTIDFLHDEIKGKEYRVIQMTWGLIVDDSATPAP
jgi:hypothetical protein